MCALHNLADEGMTERVAIGSGRGIGNSDTYTACLAVFLNVIGTEKQIILVIGMDYRWCPHGIISPLHTVGGKHLVVQLPVD